MSEERRGRAASHLHLEATMDREVDLGSNSDAVAVHHHPRLRGSSAYPRDASDEMDRERRKDELQERELRDIEPENEDELRGKELDDIDVRILPRQSPMATLRSFGN